MCQSFRQQRSFYGVDLSALYSPAMDEFFKQPIVVRSNQRWNSVSSGPILSVLHQLPWRSNQALSRLIAKKNELIQALCSSISISINFFFFFFLSQDTFDVQILVARSVKHHINFMEVKEEDLHRSLRLVRL